MKLTNLVTTVALSLFLGFAALICTQDRVFAQDQRDEAKPQQQESRPEADRPSQAARPGEARPAEQSEDKPARQENDKAKQQHDNDKSSQQMEHGGQMERNEKAEKGQHSASKRIPEEKFHSNFGRQHTFRVHTSNAGGRPNFQYGGYTFTVVDAWPAEWVFSDDYYIDYVDGQYFLFDLAHPGIRIAVTVL